MYMGEIGHNTYGNKKDMYESWGEKLATPSDYDPKKDFFNLRFQNATNQLDNTSRIKEVRKNIARIQTLITEKAKVAE